MTRVRFAPSPTGSPHVGNALSAVANRRLGDWMLLRIDDTDPQRNVPGGEEEIVRDLEWLGLAWEEGPIRQSERRRRRRFRDHAHRARLRPPPERESPSETVRSARRGPAGVPAPRTHPGRGRQEAGEARARRNRRVAARGGHPG